MPLTELQLTLLKRQLQARQANAAVVEPPGENLLSENDNLLPPRADSPSYGSVVSDNTPSNDTNFRNQFSTEGFDLAREAIGGLNPMAGPGAGVVDIPDEMPLYSEEGVRVRFPEAVQSVLEFIGDAGATGAGAASGAYGYLIGGAADILVNAGVDETTAARFARDVISMPEAFAGSATALMRRGGGGLPPQKYNDVVSSFTKSEQEALRNTINTNGPSNAVAAVLTPGELGTLLKDASSSGRRSKAAIEKLAQEAQINPEAKLAAERLGIDLPADILSDNPLLKQAASLTRDVKSSEAAAQFENYVVNASRAADEAMASINASPDLAYISNTVQASLRKTQADLKKGAAQIYADVDKQIPKSTLSSPENTISLLNQTINDMGGVDNLDLKYRSIFNKVTNPNAPLTYGALIKLKQNIGQAMRTGQGEYADVNQRDLAMLYGALAEDQLVTAQRIGGDSLRSQLRLANQTTAKQKALEDRIVSAFGKDLEGSIASKLRLAITSGSKGDISGLNRVLKAIPKELQGEAVSTAINAVSLPGGASDLPFGFAQYAKTMNGLKRNKPVYNRVKSILGTDGTKVLDDLYAVSQRITDARSRVSQTGKANQALISEGITSESLVGGIINRVGGNALARGAATVGGAVAGGPGGAMAANDITSILLSPKKTNKLATAGNLLNSAAFRNVVNADFQSNQIALQTALDKLENSAPFRKWLKAANMDRNAGRIFLQSAVVASGESGVMPNQNLSPEEIQRLR